ncbi:sensor domain-containing protein [Paenibacillus pasadenensis]|uniref:sensor domain-containing protein n=1 Tax=Paenibacillus pasadenensis TaxID=217090 RepID=UPI00203B3F20|nr:sensor domain-containing protein [Paenibacillus pasadenensis]MCM3748030.1 sensor domain-containing protein [Paenibacillus pasadenensis]
MRGREGLIIATLQATITLYDRFSSGLRTVNETLERTIELSESLKQKLSAPLQMTVQTDDAVRKVNALQKTLYNMKEANIRIKINNTSVDGDINKLRKQIETALKREPFKVQLQAANVKIDGGKLQKFSTLLGVISGTIGAIRAVSGVASAFKAGGSLAGGLALLGGGTAVAAAGAAAAGGAAATGGAALAGGAAVAGGAAAAGSAVGSGGLPGIQSLISGISSAINTIGPIFKSSVTEAMNQQASVDQFAVAAGSNTGGQAIFEAVSQQALSNNYAPAEAQQSAMEFMRVTTDPAQVTALNGIAMRMQKLNPSSGLGDNAAMLKAVMGGDAASLMSGLGVSENQLAASGVSSAVAAGDMKAFLGAMDSLLAGQGMSEAGFNQLAQTPTAKMAGLQQRVQFEFGQAGMPALEALVPVMDKITEAFESGKLDPFFGALSAGLMLVAQLITAAADGALFFMTLFSTHGDVIADVLTVLAVSLLPLLAVMLWSMIPPIVTMAAAWFMANWPILLVIAAVGLLVYWLLQSGVTAGQIIGSIVGSFYYLGAVIYNMISVAWNLFATFAEFLINLFIDPIYAVQKLFYDLAMVFGNNLYQMLRAGETFAGGFMKMVLQAINGIIGGVNKLIGGISKVFGINIDAIQELKLDTSNINSLSDSLKGMMEGIEPPKSDKNTLNLERMGQKDPLAAYGNGYKAGNDLVGDMAAAFNGKDGSLVDQFTGKDKFGGQSNMEDKTKGLTNGMGGGGIPAPGSGGMGNIDRVNEVGSINDEVDIGSEDLKVMRELAEMKAIQNFVTLTPTVQMTTGPVNSQVDVNDVVRQITTSMEKEIEASAHGVYGF